MRTGEYAIFQLKRKKRRAARATRPPSKPHHAVWLMYPSSHATHSIGGSAPIASNACRTLLARTVEPLGPKSTKRRNLRQPSCTSAIFVWLVRLTTIAAAGPFANTMRHSIISAAVCAAG